MTRFVVFILILAGSCLNACQQNSANTSGAINSTPVDWKNETCSLITDQEVEKFFNIEAKSATLNTRNLPNQAFCLRTWLKADWKERENSNEKDGNSWKNPKNRLVIQVFDYTSPEHAKMQLANLRRDRKDTYEEEVTGLGEEALWSTSTLTLLVRKGQLVLNLALDYSDTPHDNLPKAKEIAALALTRL